MKLTKLLCYILSICAVLSFLPVGAQTNDAAFVSRLGFDLEDGRILRAIILYDGDAGIDLMQKGGYETAAEAGNTVLRRQKVLTETITEEYGAELACSYTVLLNGIAVDVSYGVLKEIEKLQGVKDVYLANSFSAPEAESVKSTTLGGTGSMGTDFISGNGAGAVIAVLDTSFYLKHEAFTYTNGVTETLTAQKLQSIKDSNALNGKGEYISAKVPYVYDYADKDLNVANGATHGTAVASIALGNNGDGFYGAAKNAQLLAMKVFSDASGSTDSSIYFNALEDAYTLGADVINLSFGAQNGFTYDSALESVVFGNVYKRLRDAGVFVVCAAGNEYSEGYSDYAYNRYSAKYGVDAVTADYADYGVVSTPSTYGGNISVAAAENVKHYAYGIKVNDTAVEYFDNADSLYEHFYSNFAGRSLEYVLISGYGEEKDYTSVNASGKIAVVAKGGISDQQKLQIAASKGALGLICYNDTNDKFYLRYNSFVIPSACITKDSYEIFKNAPIKTLTVTMGAVEVQNYLGGTMCDFSSWGVAPDMTLKPDITGVGGGVLCAGSSGTEDYVLMSGTSMACPTVAGYFAAALKALPFEAGMSRAQKYELAYDLVLSSAITMKNGDGVSYSPRKQGAGLPTYEALEGKLAFDTPIINLGDDEAKTGVFTINAALKGLYSANGTITASLSGAEVLSDSFVYDEELKATYNTLTPHSLSAAVSTDKSSYSVNGKGSASVTVKVKLSEADKKYLAAAEKGAFVEGYVYFTYTDGGKERTVKLTFLAFYGDWEKGSTFESYDWGDIVDLILWMKTTVVEGTGKTYAELGYTVYDFIDTNVGFNEGYLTDANGSDFAFLGDNLYDNVSFDIDRLAFSTGGSASKHLAEKITFYPSLLRNAEHIIMTVSNADTGEVYYVDNTPYGIKDFFSTQTGEFEEGTYFQWDGTYKTLSGYKYVSNGTRVKISFQTKLASEEAELVTQREYIVYVDNEGPQINYSWNAKDKKLTVSALDNRYISNVFVFLGDYEEYIVNEAIENSAAGKRYNVSYDLSGADFGTNGEFYIEVQDYATNYTTVKLDVNKDASNITLIKGDVNMDSIVNNLDAVMILKYDAGIIDLDENEAEAANVNGDRTVNNLDATAVLKYDAGLINGFDE